MLVNDPTAAQPDAEALNHVRAVFGAPPCLPAPSGGHLDRVPEPEDGASYRSAAEAWAAECGMAMPEFQQAYFEQRLAELWDLYPAMRTGDAERLALSEAPWLADNAA